MAEKVLTIIVSDLSGDETNDGETVEFTYRGVSYAIDLTKEESAAFDVGAAEVREDPGFDRRRDPDVDGAG